MFKFRISKADLPDGTVFRKAALRTLNRVARSGESFATKKIRSAYNVPRDVVDRNITVRPASISKLQANIFVYSRAIPLYDFKARQTRRGVTVAVVRGEGRKLIRGAFVATMQSGHVGAFSRKDSGTRREKREKNGRVYSTELPIKELMAYVTVADMFRGRRVLPEMEEHVRERIAVEYPHQLQYLTRREVA